MLPSAPRWRGAGRGMVAVPELEPDRLVIKFVNEINRHDLEALRALMAPDFWFTDSLGQEVRGLDRMLDAWRTYFAECPDLRIVIRDHLVVGSVVALFGTASGSPPGTAGPAGRWSIPTAWRAVVRGGHIAEWQVYADRDPLRRPPAVPRE